MSIPAKAEPATTGGIMESVLIKGDLAKLTEGERVRYYSEVCRSIGVNPLTKPFEYITLNGKLQLYALRACTDQLRRLNNISLEIVSKEIVDGILTVHVRARTHDGRTDEDLGSVNFPDTLRGELRANTELKAVTKAKRRATLSICGLGWLDETEVEDIPSAAPSRKFINPSHRTADPPLLQSVEAEMNDEIPDFGATAPPSPESAAANKPQSPASPDARGGATPHEQEFLLTMAREAAIRGKDVFDTFYKGQTKQSQAILRAHKTEIEKLYPL